MEKVIEKKICKWTGEEFSVYEGDLVMLEKLSPTIGGEKFLLPTPDLSPKAREINRLMFRNERNFYNIKLKNGKNEISTIHPELRKNIVDIEGFNGYDFTKDGVDYSGDFFDDYKKLLFLSPHSSLIVLGMENSAYCNQEAYDKNCYLNSGGHNNEDSMYSTFTSESTYSVDNYWVFKSEIVYESLNIFESQKVFFSQEVKNCYNVFFGYDLVGCQNVIFGNDLENKNYVYKNEVLEKTVWEEKYKEFKEKLKTWEGLLELKKEFDEFIKETGRKEIFIEGSENSYGNIITNSKESFNVLYGEDNENVSYANICWAATDAMDINSFANGAKLYNVASSSWVQDLISSALIVNSNNLFYSLGLDGIKQGFGCFGFGLKNKSYLILNKEYPKEEWEKIVKIIIKELQEKGNWGRFLIPELSPYPYNDSVAMEYHPINKAVYVDPETSSGGQMKIIKEEIIRDDGEGVVYILEPEKLISKAIIDFGGEEKINTYWRTKTMEINIPDNMETIFGDKIPEIDNLDSNGFISLGSQREYLKGEGFGKDSILNKVIICERSKRPFRIVKKELDFYKKYGLPIPRYHYDERHIDRVKKKTTKMFQK